MTQDGYYIFSNLSLKEGNYKQAAAGFKYCISYKLDEEKSIIGLISAYCCMGKYLKALKIYEKYFNRIIFIKALRHEFVDTLSISLINDISAIKKQREGYFSSIILNQTMNTFLTAYNNDHTNLLSIILLGYWYVTMGKRPADSDKMLYTCLKLPTLDKNFRWKLLSRMSIGDKDLLKDSEIASRFNSVPDDISSSDYVNQLIISSINNENIYEARSRISEAKNKDISLSNETMWNYVSLCSEKKDIDDIAVLFSKLLVGNGWVNGVTSNIIKYAEKNNFKYSVEKELTIVELFGF